MKTENRPHPYHGKTLHVNQLAEFLHQDGVRGTIPRTVETLLQYRDYLTENIKDITRNEELTYEETLRVLERISRSEQDAYGRCNKYFSGIYPDIRPSERAEMAFRTIHFADHRCKAIFSRIERK